MILGELHEKMSGSHHFQTSHRKYRFHPTRWRWWLADSWWNLQSSFEMSCSVHNPQQDMSDGGAKLRRQSHLIGRTPNWWREDCAFSANVFYVRTAWLSLSPMTARSVDGKKCRWLHAIYRLLVIICCTQLHPCAGRRDQLLFYFNLQQKIYNPEVVPKILVEGGAKVW